MPPTVIPVTCDSDSQPLKAFAPTEVILTASTVSSAAQPQKAPAGISVIVIGSLTVFKDLQFIKL